MKDDTTGRKLEDHEFEEVQGGGPALHINLNSEDRGGSSADEPTADGGDGGDLFQIERER